VLLTLPFSSSTWRAAGGAGVALGAGIGDGMGAAGTAGTAGPDPGFFSF